MGEIAFGEEFVEGRDGLGLIEVGGAVGQVDFVGLAERGVDEGEFWGVGGGGDFGVGAGPTAEVVEFIGWFGGGIHLDFGAEACGGEECSPGRIRPDARCGRDWDARCARGTDECVRHYIRRDGVVLHRSDETFGPLFDLSGLCVD